MEYAFYIALAIAIILLIVLITMGIKISNLNEEKRKVFDDNRKLYSKVKKLDAAVKDTTKSRDNLSSMHEDLKDRYEIVNRVAYTDSLTELPNKQQFSSIFEGVIMGLKENDHAALAVIRLVNYDRITNATGHVAGDELILDFTQRLKANLEEEDFLARISVDEFAIITQSFESSHDYEARITRLNKILRTPLSSGGREVVPNLYFAAVKAPADGRTVQLLTLNVRLALSQAMAEGDNKVYFYKESMAEEAMKKMELTAELNLTVENKAFTYLYSAQTDLRNQKTAAFEIVPVWDNEVYGRILPKDYLKYAEDTQISKKLFTDMFTEACTKQKAFEEAGYENIKFIVPCFVGQFIDEDFVKIVYNILEESDATPGSILISVPESVILRNPQATVILMKKIEKLGIKFLLDDFGSGSSSLKALIKAPVSVVRLSGDFLDGDFKISEDQIMKSLIELIHSWKMKILVAGIDFKEQEELLKKLHADYAEGQLYNGLMTSDIALQFARISQK